MIASPKLLLPVLAVLVGAQAAVGVSLVTTGAVGTSGVVGVAELSVDRQRSRPRRPRPPAFDRLLMPNPGVCTVAP